MSKNTTDLREAISKIMTDYGVDFYEGNLMHRTEQRLALIKEFQDQILALISNREKLARIDELERPKSLVLGMNESFDFKAGFEEAVDQMERADELRLATLRKELDGGA